MIFLLINRCSFAGNLQDDQLFRQYFLFNGFKRIHPLGNITEHGSDYANKSVPHCLVDHGQKVFTELNECHGHQ